MTRLTLIFLSLCLLLSCENEVQSALFVNIKCRELSRFKTVRIFKCRAKRTILIVVMPLLLTSRSVCVILYVHVMILTTVVDGIETSFIVCSTCAQIVLPCLLSSFVSLSSVDNQSYFVCVLLLMLSGDIESNPGPGSAQHCLNCLSSFVPLPSYFVCVLLLLLSGDIEANPGPGSAQHSLNCLLVNARSIKNKVQQLHAILHLNDIDLVAITETWLNASVESAEIFDSSYQVYRKDRLDRRGGGILIAFKNHLKVSSRYDLSSMSADHNEILVVDVLCAKLGKIGIIVCYRPPNDFSEGFITNLKTTLYHCAEANLSQICLLGDLNMPHVDWDRMVPLQMSQFNIEICNIFQELNLSQCNFNASTKHGNILDVILSSFPDRISNIRCEEDVLESDHHTLFFSLNIDVPRKPKAKNRIIYDFKRVNFQLLKSTINMRNLDLLCDQYSANIDQLVSNWTKKVISYVNEVVPTIKPKNYKSHPWIDSEIKHLSNLKKSARRKAKNANSPELWKRYRQLRNTLKNAIHEKYNQYLVRESSEIVNNPKRAWNLIHSKTKTKRLPSVMQLDRVTATTPSQIANIFNSYFYSTFKKSSNITEKPPINVYFNPSLCDIVFTPDDVFSVLQHLKTNKARGPDCLDGIILKECATELAPSLTRIFNCSLQSGRFPESWKHANIIPIHKSGSINDVRNYRPISLTCIVSKVFERCVYNKINSHIIVDIHELQHGFMKGLSTTTQLLQVYDEINSIVDCKGQVDAIFLDFSKAFDSIPHELLTYKLQSFGIQGKLLSWFGDYLTNRQQRVVIDGETSPFVPVLSGVPQGSILGPLLFLLYINDLPMCLSSSSKMALYADDAKVYRQIVTYDDCLSLQSELDNIYRWSIQWGMDFNLKKCSVISFYRKKNNINFYYNMNGIIFRQENCIRDLGITVESDLCWNTHIGNIVKKAFNVLWFLKRTLGKSVLPCVKKTFYCSLVRPHLECGSIVWSVITKKNLKYIESVQRHATKFITNDYLSDYKTRLKSCNLLPLSYRREILDACFLYKRIHTNTLSIIRDKINFGGRRGRLLINDLDLGLLLIQDAKSETYKYFFTNRIVPIWNQIPEHIRAINFGLNGTMFKKHLINYFKQFFDDHFESDNVCTWVSHCRCYNCRLI